MPPARPASAPRAASPGGSLRRRARPGSGAAGAGGVALVEDEVEHREHGPQPLREQVVGRDAKGNAGVADLFLRPHEPLGDRRLGDEERVRDLGRGQAGDLAQRQRDADSAASAGWQQVKTSASRSSGIELTSSSSAGSASSRASSSALRSEGLLAAEPVDRPVPGRGDDPGAGVRRRAVAGPALERGREGVLHRVLGELEVAEDAGECCNGTAPFLPENRRPTSVVNAR